VARAARCGSFNDERNASGGAGLIEPGPFQDDPALATVKDASPAGRLACGQSLTATARSVLSKIRPGRRNGSPAEPRNE
jgi:hypothetical protein